MLLLRKRGTVVSAATVRAFGSRFCEARAVGVAAVCTHRRWYRLEAALLLIRVDCSSVPCPLQVPFVATKEGYRRDGHCRRLMQASRATWGTV